MRLLTNCDPIQLQHSGLKIYAAIIPVLVPNVLKRLLKARRSSYRMTACSFAVSAHVCWNWAVRAAPTAIPLFILAPMLNMSRSLDTRRPGSIRRPCRGFALGEFLKLGGS